MDKDLFNKIVSTLMLLFGVLAIFMPFISEEIAFIFLGLFIITALVLALKEIWI